MTPEIEDIIKAIQRNSCWSNRTLFCSGCPRGDIRRTGVSCLTGNPQMNKVVQLWTLETSKFMRSYYLPRLMLMDILKAP